MLWRFSRPHTVIGTTLSVVSLYLIAVHERTGLTLTSGAFQLACTLIAALCVNVFIVGINQLEDVAIDVINKPELPLAAGDMTLVQGRRIVAAAGVVPVAMALTQGIAETAAVLGALAVGVAYSVPPLRLKRFPAVASLSISLVRGLLVNLGVYAHFSSALGHGATIADPVWALTLFVLPFSLAIAVLKDVPDIEGDRRYAIATFSVRFGPERVVRLALAMLTLAYVTMAAAGPLALDTLNQPVYIAGHAVALALLWRWRAGVDVGDRRAFTGFYMGVWKLFFLEYAVVAAAALAG